MYQKDLDGFICATGSNSNKVLYSALFIEDSSVLHRTELLSDFCLSRRNCRQAVISEKRDVVTLRDFGFFFKQFRVIFYKPLPTKSCCYRHLYNKANNCWMCWCPWFQVKGSSLCTACIQCQKETLLKLLIFDEIPMHLFVMQGTVPIGYWQPNVL